ncbi:formate dehydrogenase accessory sulfurtransferase FdhD [Marinomonas pollencensis]|uniref:Sulfur carrier protein FdhD n=1 Tax=Marinomonas pollencensis TaxID=491954 RepID=A0A3E0DT09_9GAMM|nr:formate dehydrogenase accessory sulfurtransferase FdhD [Marinomonas pollencensis]REG86687.1 FdhD protein [Marinomonas pollencensis]
MTRFSATSVQPCHYLRQEDTRQESVLLVEEAPLAISINDITHAVMMVTPTSLDAFAIGFAFSEGLIENAQEMRDISLEKTSTQHPEIDGFAINLIVSQRRFADFKKGRIARLGATGCGLCGVESLDYALPQLTPLIPSDILSDSVLRGLKSQLFEHQIIGKESGAIHAALLVSPQGEPLIAMEDIGRHNALDKVLGYALQHNINLHNHSVVMSSRCSTELIQKAVRSGLSCLIHLASPSTLAVKLARQYGLTLIHLPKQDAPRIFASSYQLKGN